MAKVYKLLMRFRQTGARPVPTAIYETAYQPRVGEHIYYGDMVWKISHVVYGISTIGLPTLLMERSNLDIETIKDLWHE